MTFAAPIDVPASIRKTDLDGLQMIRGRFDRAKVQAYLREVFDAEEIEAMRREGVDQRMVFGVNPHYHALAVGGGLTLADGTELLPDMPPSRAILALIMPRLNETMDMSGQEDPSNQMKYSPGPLHGKILHKYDEIVLAYAAFACSAHCRYCYRLDLFNRTTGKKWVHPEELRDYVKEYNETIGLPGKIDPASGKRRYPIREVLLSGGDPMVMSNAKIYKYLVAAAQAGVKIVRIGTKEIAFRPERFDENFLETLRVFNRNYPQVHVNFVTHFSHPDEFLARDKDGNYIEAEHGLRWLPVVRKAVRGVLGLDFASMENQTPMIDRVNDDADALRLLHEELRRGGVKPKYIFQCREIEGYRAFAVPVEKAWHIHNASQKGLSDTSRSRFVMSAEHGKTEVVGVTDGLAASDLAMLPPALHDLARRSVADGYVVMKTHRSPSDADLLGQMIVARRNPEALWLSGYEDRMLYDGRKRGVARYAGLFTLFGGAAAASDPAFDLARFFPSAAPAREEPASVL